MPASAEAAMRRVERCLIGPPDDRDALGLPERMAHHARRIET